jgi:hypothetical protein
MASFDAASGQCLPRHQTHIESSFIEFTGTLGRGEYFQSVRTLEERGTEFPERRV